jgi:tRNA-specific 2-thiouridylase
MGQNGAELHRAVDDGKDQSYFLFTTTQPQLDFLRFPLGGMMSKTETRVLADRFNLPVAQKPDSQDICFVPNGDYASVVAKLRPGGIEPGDIVDEQGTVLGRHDGIIHFTVGQRRGLDVMRVGENNEPLYVLRLDAGKKQVVVGPRASLAQQTVKLRDINWLVGDIPETGIPVSIKLRSAQPPLNATFHKTADGGVVTLHEPAFGVAPGQAGVIYDGDRVLGGGWIAGYG